MSKSGRYATLLLILTIPLLLFAIGIIKIPKSQKSGTSSPSLPFSQPNQNQPQPNNDLPVQPDTSAGSDLLFLSYSFAGSVVNISPTTLTMQTRNLKPIPELPRTSTTKIDRITPTALEVKEESASISDIKKGDEVNVSAVYNYTKKSWTTHRIAIITQSNSK